jgi:hypothetical protein
MNPMILLKELDFAKKLSKHPNILHMIMIIPNRAQMTKIPLAGKL